MMDNQRRQDERSRLFVRSAASVCFWGIITYFYAFLNFTLSHDSLNEIESPGKWKIMLGRFMSPVYHRFVRGEMTIPWLSGVLSLMFLSLAVYVLARAAKTQDTAEVFLAAGLLVTSPAVFTLAGTYISDMDANMMGILLSFASVWAWRSGKKLLLLPGALCLSAAVGLYQSYLSVAVVLVMAFSILDLSDGKKPQWVFLRGMEAIAMFAVGMLAYVIMMKATCWLTNLELASGGYNSLTNIFSEETYSDLSVNFFRAYEDFKRTLLFKKFGHINRVSIAQLVVYGGTICALVYRSIKNRISVLSVCMMIALLGLLPVGVHLSMLANKGYAHDLMKCGMISVSMLALLAVGSLRKEIKPVRWCALLVMGCMAYVSWQYVVDANQLFMKKDMNRQASLSMMTRVTEDIEEYEGYVRGETPVMFTGTLNHQLNTWTVIPMISGYTGDENMTQISQEYIYPIYYQYIMQLPIKLCDEQRKTELLEDEQVKQMPVYPQSGSIQMVEDTLVVKMGE